MLCMLFFCCKWTLNLADDDDDDEIIPYRFTLYSLSNSPLSLRNIRPVDERHCNHNKVHAILDQWVKTRYQQPNFY